MKYLVLLIVISTVLISCDKIVAEDITGKIPVLIIPTSGAQVDQNPVHFKWEEMEGASKYHLMVVSPSFASPQSYLLDTLITGTEFFYSLDSNFYELKLVGVNGGYRSDTLGPIAFEVSSANGIGNGTLVLTSPEDGAFVGPNSFSGNFTWDPLQNVDSYEFALREGTDFSVGNPLETLPGISTSNHTYTPALTEGDYVWRVTANFTSGTSTFTTHTFVFDTTTPNQAILSVPANNGSQTLGIVDFTWANGSDPGNFNSPVISWLELSTDAAFTNPTIISVNGNAHSEDISTSATYYWRILNIDEAGNEAIYSDTFTFNI
jgi:hypothetical protein